MTVISNDHPAPAQLPVAALLAFAMTGFIAILTETLPAGLLPQIGHGLGISNVLAGQLVTAYALGSLLAAIPLTVLTRNWRRRPVLLLAIVGFFVFNTITTVSSSYPLTLVARFLAGVAAGLAWGILAGYARRLVPVHLQGRALALAMVGTPLALSVGVPAGSWLGALAGWRVSFGIMSALALILIVWVLATVPDLPGQPKAGSLPAHRVLLLPGMRPVLCVIFAWMLGHNILYTYIAPFLAAAGAAVRVDVVLLLFGLAALPGIWIIGLLVDRWLRLAVLASLALFALVAIGLGLDAAAPVVLYASVLLWGLSFGGAATLLQTASADAAGANVDVAQAMVTTAWNLAIAGGGLFGGLLLGGAGAAVFPWVLLALLVTGWLVAWRATAHGFQPGRRAVAAPASSV